METIIRFNEISLNNSDIAGLLCSMIILGSILGFVIYTEIKVSNRKNFTYEYELENKV